MIISTYIASEKIEIGAPAVLFRKNNIFYVRNLTKDDSFNKDCCGVANNSSNENSPIEIRLREINIHD